MSTEALASTAAANEAATSERLSGALLLLAPAAMLFIVLLRPIWDVDIFWQLRLGELILNRGGPFPSEPFSASHLGQPLAPVAWLGQAVFAEVRRLFGWTGLQIFDAFIWLGGFWTAAAACRRRGASALAVTFALAFALTLALPTASIRPQSFAALGLGLLLMLVRLDLSPVRTLLLALPLFVLWQNLHPSVSVAAIVLATIAGVAWLKRFTGRRAASPWLLSALTVLAGASVFATPAGVSILQISADNARTSVVMGVSEWLPMWAPINRGLAVPFCVTALAAGWLLLRTRHRVDWEELAPALALFVMTLTAYRFVLFWSIALVPLLAQALSDDAEPVRRASWSARLSVCAGLVAAIGLALQANPTHVRETIPLAGIKKLRETGVKGTIYNYFAWGGPLIDAGFPDWVVAYDGRYYRYSSAEWRRYYLTTRGEIGPTELDHIYHPAAYLLKPGFDEALIVALQAAPATWRQIYADPTCVVFVRNAT